MFIILCIIFLISVLLYYFLTKNSDYWEKNNIPYEKSNLLFGNFKDIIFKKESMEEFLERLYQKFYEEPYFGVYLLQTPSLVVKNPNLIRKILITDFQYFANRPTYSNKKLDPFTANVLFALKNQEWKSLRQKLTPVFTSAKMKNMFPCIIESVDQLEELLNEKNNENIDIKNTMKLFTTDTIASCAFGISTNTIKNGTSEIMTQVGKLLDFREYIRSFSVLAYFFAPLLVKIFRLSFVDLKASYYLTDIFGNISRERRKLKIERHDFVDCLHKIAHNESENEAFDLQDNIRMASQALVFFNAGSEPAATMTSLLLYELALNSKIQENVRNEIKEHFDEDKPITYDKLEELNYLDMVIKETLRKYTFNPVIMRNTERDYVDEETGFKIKKGTPIFIPVAAIHNDPKYYENPNVFDPERFRGDSIEKHLYLPFGEGPRKCIGIRFALMQMKASIVTFLRKFEVVPCEKTPIPVEFVKSPFLMVLNSLFLKIRKVK